MFEFEDSWHFWALSLLSLISIFCYWFQQFTDIFSWRKIQIIIANSSRIRLLGIWRFYQKCHFKLYRTLRFCHLCNTTKIYRIESLIGRWGDVLWNIIHSSKFTRLKINFPTGINVNQGKCILGKTNFKTVIMHIYFHAAASFLSIIFLISQSLLSYINNNTKHGGYLSTELVTYCWITNYPKTCRLK